MLRRRLRTWLPLVLVSLLLAGSVPAGEPLLLGPDYPIDVGISLPAALLHWLDSLAGLDGPGTTSGKTVPAHRGEYVRLFGPLDAESEGLLRRFAAARAGVASRRSREERHALTLAFFDAPDLDAAIEATATLSTSDELAAIRAAVEHFEPRYRRIWDDGAAPRRFLDRVRRDDRRAKLSALLARIGRFYDVPIDRSPHPRVVLVPVRPGHGTHAQAIGRHLLIEIRAGDGLVDQVAPIVHENAHFLFYRIDGERLAGLTRVADGQGASARENWRLLREALPTALGQGIAGQRFGRDWSIESPWYHLEAVDSYAKRIFPLVRESLGQRGRLDDAFVRRAVSINLRSP